jgi:uncharacterized repeat protein (TIGR01451 family)
MKSFCRKPILQLFSLILLSVLCFTAQATINLAIEVNPDPVQPGETANVAITVSNSGGVSTGLLTLQLRYDEWLNGLLNSFISDGGTCPGSGQCNANEFLTWTLGNLAPGASITVTLPPIVWGGTPDGTLISFDTEVFEDGGSVTMATRNVMVQSAPVFDIAVDESLNPVAPDQALTYTISYANRSAVSTTNTQLSFPLPAGVSFVSASGGGTFNAGVVKWNLQTFPAKKGGRKTVTVDVNSGVTLGSLLEIDAATITGIINSLSHTSRALAITRVENSIPLALEIELNPHTVPPNAVQPNETLQTSLTVGNTSGSTLFGVTLRLRYNEWLNGLLNSFISDGGACPGSSQCNDNEFLTWTLGNLASGASVTVTLPPVVWS